jgi:hypothetical protein
MSATATTLKYANTVNVDLEANAVNFADSEADGHRVQIAMTANDLNTHFAWNRAAGSDRPVGSVTDAAGLETLLAAALTDFTDLDSMATGLSFSAGTLADAELQQATSNDLIVQYVLFKVYGLSAYDTTNKVYNPKDAQNMTTNADVADAIVTDISNNNARGQAVDKMFRDLLAADPARFFDASGHQIPGLFETNTDLSGSGNWELTAGDVIEIKTTFTFSAQVSRRVVSAQEQPLDAVGGALSPPETVTEEVVIPAGHVMHIRLQIVAA